MAQDYMYCVKKHCGVRNFNNYFILNPKKAGLVANEAFLRYLSFATSPAFVGFKIKKLLKFVTPNVFFNIIFSQNFFKHFHFFD